MLSTADPDNGQTYSYSMLDGAGGRFKIQSNLVKVSYVIGSDKMTTFCPGGTNNGIQRSADAVWPQCSIKKSLLSLILKHLVRLASESVEFDWLTKHGLFFFLFLFCHLDVAIQPVSGLQFTFIGNVKRI